MNVHAAPKKAKPQNSVTSPTPTARPGANSSSLAKAPRGAKAIASVQYVMKSALDTTAIRDDPVLRIIAKWDAARAALPYVPSDLSYAASQKPQRKFDKAVEGLGKIERELARTTPTTAEGAAAALRFLLRAYGGDLDAVMDAPGVIQRVAEFLERARRL